MQRPPLEKFRLQAGTFDYIWLSRTGIYILDRSDSNLGLRFVVSLNIVEQDPGRPYKWLKQWVLSRPRLCHGEMFFYIFETRLSIYAEFQELLGINDSNDSFTEEALNLNELMEWYTLNNDSILLFLRS